MLAVTACPEEDACEDSGLGYASSSSMTQDNVDFAEAASTCDEVPCCWTEILGDSDSDS